MPVGARWVSAGRRAVEGQLVARESPLCPHRERGPGARASMGLVAWIRAGGGGPEEVSGPGHQRAWPRHCAARLMVVFGWLFKDLPVGRLYPEVMKG